MKKFLILILIAAAAFSGWWFGRREQSHDHAASTRRVLFYQSAMHPWVKSDKPGRCTICGMELSPVYEGESGYDADTKLVSLGKQGVTVTGIETVPVVKKIIRRTIRVAGMVDDDDSAHRRISATAEGRIEKLFVNFVGAEVEAGQPLASLYSPVLRTKLAEYQSFATQPASRDRDQLMAGIRERLLRYGMSGPELDAATARGQVPSELKILTPITGTVVARNVYEGQYVKEGDMLFEVGDFSKMWFVFDVYERDLPWVKMGAEVEISTPALPRRVMRAPITSIQTSHPRPAAQRCAWCSTIRSQTNPASTATNSCTNCMPKAASPPRPRPRSPCRATPCCGLRAGRSSMSKRAQACTSRAKCKSASPATSCGKSPAA